MREVLYFVNASVLLSYCISWWSVVKRRVVDLTTNEWIDYYNRRFDNNNSNNILYIWIHLGNRLLLVVFTCLIYIVVFAS